MSISSLIGTRIFSGIGALALTGSLLGGTAVATSPAKDNPIRELHHQLRDDSKAERDEIKDLRKQLAEEYAKESPDLAKMASLNEQIEAKQDGLRQMRFDALMAMHDELDAAQRERVAEHLAREHGPKDKHEGKGKHEGKAHAKGKPDGKGKPDREAKAERDGKAEDKAERDGKGKDKAERGKGKDKAKDKAERDERAEARRPV